MSDLDDIFKDQVDGANKGDLAQWVIGKCEDWRDNYESNYSAKHDEYYRLWRNVWAPEDKDRKSERSQLIAPALSQAVESNVAEVEEATFGRGKIFEIKDNFGDQETKDAMYLRNKLHEDFANTRVRSAISEALLNAAIYGTGVAEITIEEQRQHVPATRPTLDGAMQEFGVTTTYRPVVKMNPVQPKNFLIDPAADSIEQALGCAIDEYVPRHVVEELQEEGVYREEYVGDAAEDEDIEIDPTLSVESSDRIRLTKYYGKVPRELLTSEGVEDDEIEEDGHYVESIVVIANGGIILKAIPNPYMMQDRPVVAFSWDTVPSRFWGRGVCEKGYMSQKALDSELRARIDALALTTSPMLAVDATRVPRGTKLEVRPGRMLLTNGAPQEAIMPFNFGQLNAVTFQQGASLQAMVSQATAAGDASMPTAQNDVTAAGMSMSVGALIKRQKRTLVNFQENFLIPFVQKAAWRYMQFDPENYPINDYNFVAYSSLGGMAREYEVAQLSQILQVIPPDSPAHSAVVKGIIDHLNVSNREELIAAIEAGNQPNPQAQQAAQQQQQMQMAISQGQVQLLNSQAAESQARAQKYGIEARLYPEELTLKYADENNDGQIDRDFAQRVKMSELLLKEQELQLKQETQMESAKGKAEAELIKQLMEADRGRLNNAGPTPGTPEAG